MMKKQYIDDYDEKSMMTMTGGRARVQMTACKPISWIIIILKSSKSRVSSRWWCPGPSSWRGSSRWCWPSGNTRRPTGACERSPSVEAGSSKPGQALGFFSRSKKRIARPRMCYTLFVMRMAMSSYCVKFNCQVERMFNRRGWVNLDMPCRLNILSTQLESKC